MPDNFKKIHGRGLGASPPCGKNQEGDKDPQKTTPAQAQARNLANKGEEPAYVPTAEEIKRYNLKNDPDWGWNAIPPNAANSNNNDGQLVNNPATLIKATNSQNIAGQGGERPRAWTTNARMTPGYQSFKAIMEEQKSESTCSLLSKKKTAPKEKSDKMEKKLAQKPQIPKSPQMPPLGTSTTSPSLNGKTPKQAETGSAKGDLVRSPEQEESLITKGGKPAYVPTAEEIKLYNLKNDPDWGWNAIPPNAANSHDNDVPLVNNPAPLIEATNSQNIAGQGGECPRAWTANARMAPGCQSFKAIMEEQKSESTCSFLSKKKTAPKEKTDKMEENKDQGTIVPPLDSPTTSPRERILKYVPGLVIDVLPPFGANLNLNKIDPRNTALAPSREEYILKYAPGLLFNVPPPDEIEDPQDSTDL